ncbi:MAG: hypothetical protein HFI37_01435 [Lachnospiraceae bacterium]|nr:hypothetical protein [Lachnospiraceae bacterium]
MYWDFKEYTENRKWVKDFITALVITGLIARLFYKSWWGLLLFFPLFHFYHNYSERKRKEEEKKRLLKEFQSCMEMISASLLAGYALENAFLDAEKEMRLLYGAESPMQIELEKINGKVAMNQPLEKIFEEFALKWDIKEIVNFSEILIFAKRSGGDFVQIIHGTVASIRDKIQVEEEILTMIAEKRLEQKVMNVIPLFLLLYLDLISPGYLDILYGNLFGIIVMTISLGGYGAAILLSERIAKIEV